MKIWTAAGTLTLAALTSNAAAAADFIKIDQGMTKAFVATDTIVREGDRATVKVVRLWLDRQYAGDIPYRYIVVTQEVDCLRKRSRDLALVLFQTNHTETYRTDEPVDWRDTVTGTMGRAVVDAICNPAGPGLDHLTAETLQQVVSRHTLDPVVKP